MKGLNQAAKELADSIVYIKLDSYLRITRNRRINNIIIDGGLNQYTGERETHIRAEPLPDVEKRLGIGWKPFFKDLIPLHNLRRYYRDPDRKKSKISAAGNFIRAIGAEISNIPLVYPLSKYTPILIRYFLGMRDIAKQEGKDRAEFMEKEKEGLEAYPQTDLRKAIEIYSELKRDHPIAAKKHKVELPKVEMEEISIKLELVPRLLSNLEKVLEEDE